MGFLPWLRDMLATGSFYQPAQYSFDFANGFALGSFLPHLFLPQRSLQLGLCLALAALVLLFEEERPARPRQIGAAVCVGLLPLAHVHSFLCVGVAIACWLLVEPSRFRRVVVFVAAAGVLSAAVFFAYFSGRATSGFVAWAPGWLVPDPGVDRPWLVFAWLNWGFLLPLVALAAWRRRRSILRDPVVLAGLALFAAGNLFRFAPWAWDNTKIFVWAHLFLMPMVVRYLAGWWRAGLWNRAAVILLVAGLTATGWLEVIRLAQPGRAPIVVWRADAIDLAREFNGMRAWSDVVLASTDPHHFATGLGGAQVVAGFAGWLWSTGLDTGPLVADMREMYSGSEAGQALMGRYRVRYAIFDAGAIAEFQANEAAFRDRFPLVLERAGYRIYDVTRAR
jgi:hypothetical protein